MTRPVLRALFIGAIALLVVPFAIAVIAGLAYIASMVVSLLWRWIIPDLFPGAVEQGLIARTISYWTAFKLVVVLAVFGGIMGGCRGKSDCCEHH